MREGFSNDGQTVYASGLKRVNTTEQHLNFLEAQSKHSVKKEYSWDADLAAAEGASVDPEIEKQRQRLAKESAARKAAEKKRIAAANAKAAKEREKDAVHGKYATIVDDDIMDEAAGRRRLELAALSEKKHREAEEYRISCVQEERARIRNTKSKIHSHNDKWNAQIDERRAQERELAALLGEIRGRVATGEAVHRSRRDTRSRKAIGGRAELAGVAADGEHHRQGAGLAQLALEHRGAPLAALRRQAASRPR